MAYKNDRTKNRRRYKSRYRSAHNYKQKRSASQTKAAVLVSVMTFVVIASLIVVFTFGDSIYHSLDKKLSDITATEKVTEATEKPTVKPTQKPTQPPTEPPTLPPVEQDAQFMSLLKKNNLEVENIAGSQIIFVDGDETTLSCKVYCYEKDDAGAYKLALGPFDGYIGSSGISETVGPQDYITPIGVFNIEYAFGTKMNPGCGVEYTQFDVYDRWVTDPASLNYNRWVDENVTEDWSTSQWLYEYTLTYPHAVVFDYNRSPVDKTKGCAKFLHVSDGPTKGGVGISETDICSIMYWLNASKLPQIAIAKAN
ncbi:MAG: hypothetical protein IKB73_06930 [Ruminococcus sp.]|nr:hypothetical protein [Ruminococcus sp.]